MTAAPWDPVQYDRFEAERDRAALDLLVRLPSDLAPRVIHDLGCGTGRHAALLKRRWPDAAVHGLDRDPAMLETCRARPEDVRWVEGDVSAWSPDGPVDLIFANASLHWAPDHAALFPRLARALAGGGALAVQMPLRAAPLHHRVVAEVSSKGPWAARLASVAAPDDPLSPEGYHDLLSPICEEIDLWSTTYLHALHGPDPVLEWLKGAGLRPHLAALADDPDLSRAFLSRLGEALSGAFPRRVSGAVLLPFPRLFLVARRG
ncbi:MAG: methyltransferase domain-containing protein [Alphaproteobacteria bacterium]|nr:methyltransferase domain-containing protein [Alphaproteobacteria bacterium]MBU1524925.1 methyltransferase domain-containing protein [Alphaproteobacteria bacterium]MBU2117805.1 methyltransferase domain-containing protein [Alphaproteobacteria bacterium]MBU2352067.1 methyltransferase domain-containing protein [Alphaproteobacteria bacterium]MBU2381806.1 methyltransferase domain-containing protein [Alphaproteobacteria bacterium]